MAAGTLSGEADGGPLRIPLGDRAARERPRRGAKALCHHLQVPVHFSIDSADEALRTLAEGEGAIHVSVRP